MKKISVVGCFLAIFMLMMSSSVSALNFEIVEENFQSNLSDETESIDVKGLREKLKEDLFLNTQDPNRSGRLRPFGWFVFLCYLKSALRAKRDGRPILAFLYLWNAFYVLKSPVYRYP